MRLKLLISVALIFMTVIVYSQSASLSFSGPDIGDYITHNDHVISGLNVESIKWAFTTFHAANWHPLTWLSHMTDCQLFGLNSGSHHIVNVAFHLINIILLFFLLCILTGEVWRSAFVAAFFAIHPIHVESVAWCAERKDVLSAMFWMISLICYAGYVKQSKLTHYFLALFAFVLGLMAKPMLVTLPLVLLLLDYWPLGRFRSDYSTCTSGDKEQTGLPFRSSMSINNTLRLLLEKVPFLLLSVISSFVTIFAQKLGGAMATLSYIPFSLRVKNALFSYVSYIRKMLWPSDLAIFYPASKISVGTAVAAALFLICVSFLVLKKARRKPYLAFGWFWYIITLVPVIGLLQVGGQSMADRYTYIPLIGLFIMIVWGVAEIGTIWPRLRNVLLVAAGGALVACSYLSWVQVKFWQNDLILYSHAIEATKKNYVAYLFLGNVYMDQGKIDQAIEQYFNSIKISPTLMAFHYLGNAYYAQGKFEQANSYYFYALMISQDYPDTHYMYGRSLIKLGRVTQAIDQFNWALKIKPDYTECRASLEQALTTHDAMPALDKP
jgi:hypothetical protein